MPSYTNNDFGHDTRDQRTERNTYLGANIGTHGAALGLPAALIAQAATADDTWDAALADAEVENGEMDAAFEYFLQKSDALRNTLIRARKIIKVLVKDPTPANKQIAEEFGISGNTPRSYGKLKAAVNTFIEAHTRHTTAADGIVIPAALLTTLNADFTAFNAARLTAMEERKESEAATDEVETLYEAHSQMYAKIAAFAAGALPDDSPIYYDLGMIPPASLDSGGGQIPTPTATYNEGTEMLGYESEVEPTSFDAQTSPDGGANWVNVNVPDGATEVLIARGSQDILARVRIWTANGASEYSAPVSIPAADAAAPGGLTFVPAENGNPAVFSFNPVAGAENYEIWYQPDGNPANQLATQSGTSYPWTPWLLPGTYMVRTLFAGGIMSEFATLHVE